MPTYIPRKGDYIAVTFDPQSGHEQKGRRPALVVSNDLFNRHNLIPPLIWSKTFSFNFNFSLSDV